MTPAVDAMFARSRDGGQRLWLLHTPAAGTPVRGSVLFVHPLAEEMNKSRRMVAVTARALATDGWAVLLIDLKGCGDSSGELEFTRWDDWLDDLVQASGWLEHRYPGATHYLWGLRLGCLLCAEALARLSHRHELLFWQPPLSGKTLLQQFLRLTLAGHLQVPAEGKAALQALKAARDRGEAMDVAGYRLSADLAAGIEASTLVAPPGAVPAGSKLLCLEVGTSDSLGPSPATARVSDAWTAAGSRVTSKAVAGPLFWQTTEIETAPELTAATRQALLETAA